MTWKWKYKNLKPKWERLSSQIKEYSSEAKKNFKYVEWYYTKGKENASFTARHFGVHRKTITKWVSRFDEANLNSLEEYSRRPHQVRQWEITEQEEARIISLRKKYIRLGKIKLAVLYKQEYGQEVSSWKTQRVIELHKLYYSPKKEEKQKRKIKRGKNHKKKRITELTKKSYPYFLIQIDTVVRYWNNTKRYIITAVDHGTKIAFARMYTNHSSASAADFLKRLKILLNEKIINVQTDNGSEFHKHFISACNELNIEQYWSRVRTPKDNAGVERFNRTLNEEFIQMGHMTWDVTKFNQWLTEWLIFYNFKRPHQSLDYLAPFDHYSNTSKLAPMYPSRTTSFAFFQKKIQFFSFRHPVLKNEISL